MRRAALLTVLAAVAVWSGCHGEPKELPPLPKRLIGISDKFYDVQALDAERAVVVGYSGKVLLTTDGGFTWTPAVTGTDAALYRVRFVDAKTGWICGQEGLVLNTTDGGSTWKRQNSGTNVYLFSLYFLDARRGWAVGDKSVMIETQDGGASWTQRKIKATAAQELSAEEAIASQDPVFYDVHFADSDNGWIFGEFGNILRTTDGGKTWAEQQQSLIGGEVMDALDIPTFFGASFVSDKEGVASGLDGKIARTQEAGASWKFEPMKLDYPIVDPLYTPVILPDGSGWAVGAAGEVVRTKEGGPWQRVKLGMEVSTWLRGMHWLDQQNGWIVGGYGLILHTKDGGQTWIPSVG